MRNGARRLRALSRDEEYNAPRQGIICTDGTKRKGVDKGFHLHYTSISIVGSTRNAGHFLNDELAEVNR
jgi:hypothetical protein